MKDVKISMNTGEGMTQFTTQKIVGTIGAIIINTDGNVSLTIRSELGYGILNLAETKDIEGSNYLPVQSEIITTTASRIKVAFEKFHLNERLVITANGGKDIKLDIIFRIFD